MATFVRAPDVAASANLSINFNTDVFFHTTTGTVPAQLSSLTMSGFEDYQLVWFGIAIAGNTSTITSTSFQTNIENTGMLEAFSSSAQGVDWDLLFNKSTIKNNAPTTDSRLGAIVETEYFTFTNVTASTLSEAYKEVWTDGKLANDPTDPNYNDYEHTFALDFTTSTIGTGGHIYNDDVTNVLFLSFWGPGRYVREAAKRFQIRPTSNQTQEFILQACLRTENTDTVFSDIARLRESTTGLPAIGGTTFFYNQGEDTDWVTNPMRDSESDMIDTLVYPHTSLVQLSYPRPTKFEDKDDQTTFGFIYEGLKISTITTPTSDPLSRLDLSTKTHTNNTADIVLDFIINKRYGMGELIADSNSTIVSDVVPSTYTVSPTPTHLNGFRQQTRFLRTMLYDAQQRADEDMTIRDSAGTTSTQKRYTFNSVLDQEANKFETLKKILANMNAQYYFHNGYLKIYQDKPSVPTKVVNQSNSREVKFTGRNHQPEFNTCYVKYNNERKMFKQDTAFAELRDQLNTGYPVVSKEVVMQGITNKHQAERHAKYIVESNRTEKEFVEYVAGADHCYNKPGDLIIMSHTDDDGQKFSGRIKNIWGNLVEFDQEFTVTVRPFNKGLFTIFIDNAIFRGINNVNPFAQEHSDNMVFRSTISPYMLHPVPGGYLRMPNDQYPTNEQQITTKYWYLQSTVGLEDINYGNVNLTPFQNQAFVMVEQNPRDTVSPNTGRVKKPSKSYMEEKIYRIQSIAEIDTLQYKVVAQRYNKNKWQEIEIGSKFGVDFDLVSGQTYREDLM